MRPQVTLRECRSEISPNRSLVTKTFPFSSLLCHALQFSFKSIAYYIRRATLINLTGLAGSSNTTGDDQKKLDVIGNDLFIAAMKSSGKCRMVISEEEENAIVFNEPHARYVVACDPIDGSSNLDAGVSVGTIFGIFKLPEKVVYSERKVSASDVLLPGTELVAAGFTMYDNPHSRALNNQTGETDRLIMEEQVRRICPIGHDRKGRRRQRIYNGKANMAERET